MRCSRAASLLSAFQDGELSDPRRQRIEAHLADCDECSALLGEMQRISTSVRALETEDEPLGAGWETTLAARLAIVDSEIEAEEMAAAARGSRVVPQVFTMAAMLLVGLSLGLLGSRLLPAYTATSSTEVTAVDSIDRTTQAPENPEDDSVHLFETDLSNLSTPEFVALASKRNRELSTLAEDAYIALTDVKVPEYLPGESYEEKVHYLDSELRLLQLAERSKSALMILDASPVELLDGPLRHELRRLSIGLQAVCGQLQSPNVDARTRLMAAREEAKELLACSARAASRLQISRRRAWTLGGEGENGLPALATRVRYHALRRQGAMFKSNLNNLAKRLGEQHPYVQHHRSFWAPIAELRPDGSSEPLKLWIECHPELEQMEIVFIIQSGNSNGAVSTGHVHFQTEIDSQTLRLFERQMRHFRQFIELPTLELPKAEAESQDR